MCARDLRRLSAIEVEAFSRHLDTKRQLNRVVGLIAKENVPLDGEFREGLERFLTDRFSARTANDVMERLEPYFTSVSRAT